MRLLGDFISASYLDNEVAYEYYLKLNLPLLAPTTLDWDEPASLDSAVDSIRPRLLIMLVTSLLCLLSVLHSAGARDGDREAYEKALLYLR